MAMPNFKFASAQKASVYVYVEVKRNSSKNTELKKELAKILWQRVFGYAIVSSAHVVFGQFIVGVSRYFCNFV